jgi:hypothetical protein
MRELFSHVSGPSQKPRASVQRAQPAKYSGQTLGGLIASLLDADYGHSATALLGIAVLGILLAFPTLMF